MTTFYICMYIYIRTHLPQKLAAAAQSVQKQPRGGEEERERRGEADL
jgi:hypothetical protein